MPALPDTTESESSGRAPRGPFALALLAVIAVAAFSGFVALGTWQLHRMAWKHALIARVDARVHAPPVAAPAPDRWGEVTAESDEYRHVRLEGRYLYDRQVLAWASTDFGNGYWVMTPLQMADGVVLVNRGFVPSGHCASAVGCEAGPDGSVVVTGLLRISQTYAFLRHNDPAHGRWYSRDVAAIASAQDLDHVAPFFVDADADPNDAQAWPRGGLTTIRFADNHLVYLLTWYALALMVAFAAFLLARHEYRLRRRLR